MLVTDLFWLVLKLNNGLVLKLNNGLVSRLNNGLVLKLNNGFVLKLNNGLVLKLNNGFAFIWVECDELNEWVNCSWFLSSFHLFFIWWGACNKCGGACGLYKKQPTDSHPLTPGTQMSIIALLCTHILVEYIESSGQCTDTVPWIGPPDLGDGDVHRGGGKEVHHQVRCEETQTPSVVMPTCLPISLSQTFYGYYILLDILDISRYSRHF